MLLNHIFFLSWTTCRAFERHLWTSSSFKRMFSEAFFVTILFFDLYISADFPVCQSAFQVPDTRAKHCIPVMFLLYTKVSYLSNPVYNFSLTLRDWSWFSVWTTPLQFMLSLLCDITLRIIAFQKTIYQMGKTCHPYSYMWQITVLYLMKK